MKKTLFSYVFLFFVLSTSAQAEKFAFTSYFPVPSGKYQTIQLVPQSAFPTTNCSLGMIYSNLDDQSLPYFCALKAGVPTFSPFSGVWTLNGNDLYLTDTLTPANKKVGIGTTTPIFKLTLANDGGILADSLASASSALPISGAGTRLIWYPFKGAFRAGYVAGTEWDDASIGTSSMAMGFGNIASSQGASVWGGQNNSASAGVSPFAPVIAGGQANTTTKELAQILGGSGNRAGIGAKVAGKNNLSDGNYSTIGGGESNLATENYSTISGGSYNISHASALTATISGGSHNEIWPANYNTISGGNGNVIDVASNYSTITGGTSNVGYNVCSVVSGGKANTASGEYSTVSGGDTNTANIRYSTISGGRNNAANCPNGYCSVGGGNSNRALGDYSTILGGNLNTANGYAAIIPGGASNTAATGSYSLACGTQMNISGSHSFIWGHSFGAITPIPADNAMIIYSGSMGIRDTSPAALLEINGNNSPDDHLNLTSTSAATVGNVLTIKNDGRVGVNQSAPTNPLEFGNGAYVSAAGNFIDASSREYKENVKDLNVSDALAAFSSLTPVQYNYKIEPDHRYVGFIAEDVPKLVADQGRQGLSPMKIAAVLTKVIAHQQDILTEQKETRKRLLKEILELKEQTIHQRN